jgi:hypothetical protein
MMRYLFTNYYKNLLVEVSCAGGEPCIWLWHVGDTVHIRWNTAMRRVAEQAEDWAPILAATSKLDALMAAGE